MLQEMETGKEKIKNYKGKRGGKVMKKKGFTLIELVVVVAIILLLAATLAPKLRKEVAKARDAKAVAALGSVRTAVNVYLADSGTPAVGLYSTGTAKTSMIYNSTSSDLLEDNLVSYLKSGTPAALTIELPVGGTRATAADGDISYGGFVDLNYDASAVTVNLADTGDTTSGLYDTKGNAWASY
jgi:prepilin-type N-terminal cleavage/methylation domain-containing protein